MSAENMALLEKRYRTTIYIVLAQIAVTLILIAAALFIVKTTETGPATESLMPLWVGLLFIAVGSFLLRRMFFNWERLKNIALLRGVPGLLGTLQTNSIILGAMAEIIAIIGFLIATFSGNSGDMLRAGAIALVIFLINFPRKSIWKKIVANLERV